MHRGQVLTLLAAALALPAAGAWACATAEVPGPPVCSERARCPADMSCVLGRCRKPATMPVSANAPRLTFEPVDLAWLNGDGVRARDEVGPRFVFGKRGEEAILYLRFAVAIPAEAELQRALLTLEPMPCANRPGRVTFEVAQVLAPWASSDVTFGSRPELGLPMQLAEISATPARALRLDVTELVAAWQRHHNRYHGVALRGIGDSDSGACYTSGLERGRGPRLDVYLWPDEDAGKTEAPDAGGSDGGDAS